jgi:hypothetical protein
MDIERRVKTAAWSLSLVVALIAVFAWGNFVHWRFNSNYRWFPMFGLLAYSIMWSHYMAVAMRLHFRLEKSVMKKYFALTSGAVLMFILLHPGLLVWQLWRDGYGLPPESYLENYIAPGLKVVGLFGSISLVIFLIFELHRVFGERKWWRFVQYGSDAAMVLIFIHALRLGSLMNTWFRYVWYFYGASYVFGLLYIYIQNSKVNKEVSL